MTAPEGITMRAPKMNGSGLTGRHSFSEIFLEPVPRQDPAFPPLTPFLVHLWRMNEAGCDPLRRSAQDTEGFLYWLFDTFHRQRAPYRWPVPPEILGWMNQATWE